MRSGKMREGGPSKRDENSLPDDVQSPLSVMTKRNQTPTAHPSRREPGEPEVRGSAPSTVESDGSCCVTQHWTRILVRVRLARPTSSSSHRSKRPLAQNAVGGIRSRPRNKTSNKAAVRGDRLRSQQRRSNPWRQSSVGQSLRAEENILGQTAAVSAPGRIMPVALRLATVDGLRLVRASNQRRLESWNSPRRTRGVPIHRLRSVAVVTVICDVVL